MGEMHFVGRKEKYVLRPRIFPVFNVLRIEIIRAALIVIVQRLVVISSLDVAGRENAKADNAQLSCSAHHHAVQLHHLFLVAPVMLR